MSVAILQAQTDALFRRKRMIALSVPVLIVAYLAFIFVTFDIAGLGERMSVKNAQKLVSDVYSYKTHVTRDNRSGAMQIAIEGERKGRYPDGTGPDWVALTAGGGDCRSGRWPCHYPW